MADPVADILSCVVAGIVEHPEVVAVSAYEDAGGTTYEVRVAEDDMGKVIGRQGRVASSLRLVARAAAMKRHQRVQVEFVS